MALRNGVLFLAIVAMSGLAGACGGNVEVPTAGDGGGGAGGAGQGGAGNAGAAQGGAGDAGSAQGGAGNAGSGQGGAGNTAGQGGAAGSTGECESLEEIGCLGAYPQCVPIYDDKCCPSCEMGGCADCINIAFHHCAPGALCNTADFCGLLPDWACSGGEAECDIDPGGSQTPCATVPGCIPAYCPTNLTCDQDPICHPVRAKSCTTMCDSVPPPCPDGTYPEGDGFCYTGLCIPESLCGVGP